MPADLSGKAEIVSGDPRSIVAALRERGFENLYVDGGRTIQSLLDADLIDELIITRVPILLGDGVPLFGRMKRTLAFRHAGTEALSPELTRSRYLRDGSCRVGHRPAFRPRRPACARVRGRRGAAGGRTSASPAGSAARR